LRPWSRNDGVSSALGLGLGLSLLILGLGLGLGLGLELGLGLGLIQKYADAFPIILGLSDIKLMDTGKWEL
jgi:hypothetical protein